MNELEVKQLVEQLGQFVFNANNWSRIAACAIDDNGVFGGLVKLTGKEIKKELVDATNQVSSIAHKLSIAVGNFGDSKID